MSGQQGPASPSGAAPPRAPGPTGVVTGAARSGPSHQSAHHPSRRDHHQDERHRQHRRLRPLPTPAAVGRRPAVRRRRRQGHPVGGLPRRGHHHHGGGGGPPGPPASPRGRRRVPVVRHGHPGLPGQDQRHRDPRRPPATQPRRRLRLRWGAAVGGGGPADRSERRFRDHPRGAVRPARRPAHLGGRVGRQATGPPPYSSATTRRAPR